MNRTTLERGESTNVERLVVRENYGVRQMSSTSIVVGYVVAGAKRLYHTRGVIQCREGDIFVLNPGVHYEENRAEGRDYYEQIAFCFDPTMLQDVLCSLNVNYGVNLHSLYSHHSCPMCEGCNATSAAASEQLCDLFVAVKTSLRHSALLKNDVSQRLKLNELVYLILSSGDNCLRHRLLRLADSGERHFVQIVHDNLFRDISVDALASLTNRSTTTFKRDFRQIFGTSPHRWFVEQRLLRARIMIRSTSATVSEIAHQSGFASASHFIKLFRRHFDTTPCEMRRNAPILHEEK